MNEITMQSGDGQYYKVPTHLVDRFEYLERISEYDVKAPQMFQEEFDEYKVDELLTPKQ